MSFAVKVLPIAFAATAFIAGCSDISSPTQPFSAPSALASKGGTGGGGTSGGGTNSGGSNGGGSVQLVVTTPPTVDATGTWVGTTDGPDVVHTYTLTLTQTAGGAVSGVSSFRTPFTNGFELVVGTVNGDTLALYGGPGTVCASCQLTPLYRGIISIGSRARIDGSFVPTSVSPTFFKQ